MVAMSAEEEPAQACASTLPGVAGIIASKAVMSASVTRKGEWLKGSVTRNRVRRRDMALAMPLRHFSRALAPAAVSSSELW
jgi:hypothetical protein